MTALVESPDDADAAMPAALPSAALARRAGRPSLARRLGVRLFCALNGIRAVSSEGVLFQRGRHACGVACLEMLLTDRGVPYGADVTRGSIAGPGLSMLDIRRVLDTYGVPSTGQQFPTCADVRVALHASPGTSALVVLEIGRLFPYWLASRVARWVIGAEAARSLWSSHWTLVDRIGPITVRLRDPALGSVDMPVERFAALWDGPALLVGRPAERSTSGHRAAPPRQPPPRPPGPDLEAPVTLDTVSRAYEGRVLAVDHVSLELRRAELFCLLGPNGAGKTTLVKMITGVLPPTSGRVILDGIDVWAASDADRAALRRTLGYMPERPFFYDRLTAVEYLEFIGQLCGVDKARLRPRITEHLHELRLDDKAHARIGSLSHGMRRKLAFIAAQLHEPQLLLLDEPTVGLDPASARLVKARLHELTAAGRTILMTTHVLEVAERLADRIAVLDRGRLLFVGALDEMRADAGRTDADLEELFLRLTEPAGAGAPGPDPPEPGAESDG